MTTATAATSTSKKDIDLDLELADLDSVDSLFDLDDEAEVKTESAAVSELDEDVAEQLDAALDALSVDEAPETAPEVKKAKKEAKVKTPRAPAAPKGDVEVTIGGTTQKVSGMVSKLASDELRSTVLGIASHASSGNEDTDVLAVVLRANALPGKVQDKAVNYAEHLATGRKLSPYTQIALDCLKANPAMARSALQQAYIVAGYTTGTAGAQASQMMKLLPWAGLATTTGRGQLTSTK